MGKQIGLILRLLLRWLRIRQILALQIDAGICCIALLVRRRGNQFRIRMASRFSEQRRLRAGTIQSGHRISVPGFS